METLTEAVYAATTKIYQKMQAEQASAQQQAGPGQDLRETQQEAKDG